MATLSKFNQFVQDLAQKVHNLNTDSIKVALTNSLPDASNAVLSDITEISYTYCSSRGFSHTSCAQTSGTLKFILADLVLTASGGDVGPFQYIVVYNDTQTSPVKPLIGWFNYGSAITLHTGEIFTIDLDNTNGILTIA